MSIGLWLLKGKPSGDDSSRSHSEEGFPFVALKQQGLFDLNFYSPVSTTGKWLSCETETLGITLCKTTQHYHTTIFRNKCLNYEMFHLTFLWQTSSLAQSRLSVQQLALGASGCHRGSSDCIPVVTERVSPARVPGGILSQPPLGLRLETRFMDTVAGRGHPVAIDLVVDVFVGDN